MPTSQRRGPLWGPALSNPTRGLYPYSRKLKSEVRKQNIKHTGPVCLRILARSSDGKSLLWVCYCTVIYDAKYKLIRRLVSILKHFFRQGAV